MTSHEMNEGDGTPARSGARVVMFVGLCVALAGVGMDLMREDRLGGIVLVIGILIWWTGSAVARSANSSSES